MAKIAVLIVAAGRGSRVGGNIPKQYLPLDGQVILDRTIGLFEDNAQIDFIRVVIHPNDLPLYKELASHNNILPPVNGGLTRQQSVKLGLESLALLVPDFVLIHDAARPFVDNAVIGRIIQSLEEGEDAVIPVLPIFDSLKECVNGSVLKSLDRASIFRAQTPQGFRYATILDAHEKSKSDNLSDDSAVVELAGLSIKTIEGSEVNKKITNVSDFSTPIDGQSSKEIRTGFGFDVHAFDSGNKVTLCGVNIPFNQSLKGHSDADVGLHAITDALLGATGNGDLGDHFPPSEEKWRGEPSRTFLSYAKGLLDKSGGYIINIDVTFICELPKISPYRLAMRQSVSDILDLEIFRVNIKATTTEGLGFTGRGEGICCQASINVCFDYSRSN